MQNNLERLRYEAGEVSEATGVVPETLKNWVARGLVNPENGGCGTGKPRKFKLSALYKVAIMSRLGEFGIGPSVAEPIAAEFTDRADNGRAPGEFYSSGKTWLVATGSKNRIVNTLPGASVSELLDENELGVLTHQAIVIDLTRFIESLDSKLKIADYKEQTPTYRLPGIPGEIEFK